MGRRAKPMPTTRRPSAQSDCANRVAGVQPGAAPILRMRARHLSFSVWALSLFAVLCLWTGSAAAVTFPTLTGRVVDDAKILSPQVNEALSGKLETLEKKTSRQLVIVTLPSLQGLEIEDYGYQLGRAWGIGEKSRNDGVLLIVAPKERRVRIEVGYGLEGVLTDALSTVILQERVLPRFRAGDASGGVTAGADALIEQLSLPDEQAKSRVAASTQAKEVPTGSFPFGLLWLLGLWVVFGVFGMFRGGPGHRMDFWFLPFLLLMGGSGMGGSRMGGRGGGGFGGGGGSFGGGGASGGW
jgi:uncharacterized protein